MFGLLNYVLIVILAAMIGVGGFFSGKYAGAAECEAAHLRGVIKAAEYDATEHGNWEDENVDAALATAEREERNANVVKKIQDGIARDGGDGPCVRARFLRQLKQLQ